MGNMADVELPHRWFSRERYYRALKSLIGRKAGLTFLVLGFSLGLTVTGYKIVDRYASQQTQQEFSAVVEDISHDISTRMAAVDQSLNASRALVLSSKRVTKDQWVDFQKNQKLEAFHPMTLGIGMAVEVRREDVQRFEQSARLEEKNYRIWPPGDRALYAPIRLKASNNDDPRAAGLDLYSEPLRRAAMARARDTGDAALTTAVILVGAGTMNDHKSIILFLPVYKKKIANDATPSQRQAALWGYVYCPIFLPEFFSDIAGKASQRNIAFSITDSSGSNIISTGLPGSGGALAMSMRNEVYGQTWQMQFQALPQFTGTLGNVRAEIIAVAGLLSSLLLCGIVFVLTSTRHRAEEIAKKSARELRDTESLFRKIWDTTNDAVVLLDEQRTIRFASPALEQILGYRPDDVIGGNIGLLHLAGLSDANLTGDTHAESETPDSRNFETTGVHRNGQIVPVEVSQGSIVFQDIPGLLVFIRDITKRKEAAEALQASEEKYRQMVELSPETIAIHQDERWVFLNTAAVRALGYEHPAQLLGRPMLDSVPPESHDQARERWKQLYEKAQSPPVEDLKMVRADGSVVYMEPRAAPILWEGRPAGQVVARDVTAQRDAERALKKYALEQERLAKQVEWQRARLIEAQAIAKIGSWEVELQSGTVVWSEETLRIFERKAADFAGTYASFREFVHADDREKVDAAWELSLREGPVNDVEHRIVTPDGRIKIVDERWQIFRDEQGQAIRAVGTCQDITERRRAEQSLREYAQRLQAVSRQLFLVQDNERRLLARELHDTVGQELTALSLNLSIVRSSIPEHVLANVGRRLDDSQNLLEEATQHLRNVMGELRPPGLEELGVLRAMKEHARQVTERTGLKIVVSGVETKGRFSLSTAIAIYRIAQEALNNVVKHAAATEAAIELSEGNGMISLTIADNGKGIDTSLPNNTSGMGMTTMRERAESIGGHLRILSTIGKGTQIIMEIAHGG